LDEAYVLRRLEPRRRLLSSEVPRGGLSIGGRRKGALYGVGGCTVAPSQGMRVHGHRDGRAGVTQSGRHGWHRQARVEEQRGMKVPQAVWRDGRQFEALAQRG
jgi:hypothetical protein